MIKTCLSAMAILALASGVAFANASADTDNSLAGCPQVSYVNGHKVIIGPQGKTAQEQAFLRGCSNYTPSPSTNGSQPPVN